MALTIKEKEHWKERISRRIDHAIEQLLTNEDSEFRRRVEAQATERAWESLGIKSLRDEVLQIEQETARLAARREEVYAAMAAELPNGPVVPKGVRYYSIPDEVQRAVRRRRTKHIQELMAAAPLGRKILRLEQEKEELLDTVWLATSPREIKQLWVRFGEMLGWEPPEVQKQAVSIEPSSNDA